MATVSFITDGTAIDIGSGSGLGFFGAGGVGYSIPVTSPATYNSRTFITQGDGTSSGAEGNNNKYVTALAPTGVIWGQISEDSAVALTRMSNAKSTMNIRFTHGTPVQTQNAEFRAYDRVAITNSPSGIIMFGAQVIHTATAYTNTGSGDSTWVSMSGASPKLTLYDSPGATGVEAQAGGDQADTRHDWFVALSLTPTSVGSKTSIGGYFACEFL